MSRRSFGGQLAAWQREQERTHRSQLAERKRQEREQLLAQQASVQQRADNLNRLLAERIRELSRILADGLDAKNRIDFDTLLKHPPFPPFVPPPELATAENPRLLTKLFAKSGYEAREYERRSKLAALYEDYERQKQQYEAEVARRVAELDAFEKSYTAGEPSAIVAYYGLVLEHSEYPEGFPQEFRLAYVPEPKELVIDYRLPGVKVIPVIAGYKYVKSRAAIDEKERKQAEIKELYQDVVAAVALRTIHEAFDADQKGHLETVVFSSYVRSVDPATGKDIQPYLISVRVTRQAFLELDLRRVDKRACLRNLGAQVSPRPAEMQPVRPILEFDMVDRRFVDQIDVMSELDARPNLMDLDPFEFENLVGNLFSKMGLETKQTQASRDGGVDCVAYDPRPIVGGKVVIQAKRYTGVVGVAAVRDLYGTMINEGASKGILVTTSHYGADAYEFAKNKPIELIDGGNLLYLLDQVGVKARIVFAEDSSR